MSDDPTRQLPNDDLKQIIQLFNTLNERFTSLNERFTSLEEKVDRRLQETRPIWEVVLARLDKVENDMTAVRSDVSILQSDVTAGRSEMQEFRAETRDQFEVLGEKFNLLTEDLMTVRAGQRRLDVRVTKLEAEHPQQQ